MVIDGLVPTFSILGDDSPPIKIALIEQLIPVSNFLIEKVNDEGYQEVVNQILPLCEKFLYDPNDQVREHAINCLVNFGDVLTTQDRGDQILRSILALAHEHEDENLRVTALQILNRVAEFIEPELCEKFIVMEIKSLAQDQYPIVRRNVAGNLNNVCQRISR